MNVWECWMCIEHENPCRIETEEEGKPTRCFLGESDGTKWEKEK